MATIQLNEDDAMLCPACGSPHDLHVDEATMVGRPEGEDGPLSYANVTEDGAVYVLPSTTRARGSALEQVEALPPGRRHHILLAARCGLCGTRSVVIFTQHKGTTYVETRLLTGGADGGS